MIRRPLTTTAAALFALVGCGEADPEDGHDRGHDHAAGVDHHDDEALATDKPVPPSAAAPSAATPQPFSLGGWTATLQATDTGLRLSAKDARGADVAAAGEARVVLTGTGEDEQRVVLAAGTEGWTGSARATGAKGYVAVVSLEVDGHTETARVTWGEVPDAAPAPKAEEPTPDHDDGHDHGHGHGH